MHGQDTRLDNNRTARRGDQSKLVRQPLWFLAERAWNTLPFASRLETKNSRASRFRSKIIVRQHRERASWRSKGSLAVRCTTVSLCLPENVDLLGSCQMDDTLRASFEHGASQNREQARRFRSPGASGSNDQASVFPRDRTARQAVPACPLIPRLEMLLG